MPLLPIDDAERARDQVERQRVTQQARRTATPRLSVTTPEERFRAVERRFAVPTLEQRRAQEDDGGLLGRIGGVARSLVEPAVRTAISVSPLAPLQQAEQTARGFEAFDAPRGAAFGAGAGIADVRQGAPVTTPFRQAVQGALEPRRFPGRDVPGVRDIENPLLREAAGLGVEAVVDPLNLVPVVGFGPDIARAGRGAVRSVGEEITEQAIRRAEGPLETSTRGFLRPARPTPIEHVKVWEWEPPPVPEGHVRLWRGEPIAKGEALPGAAGQFQGRWFTMDRQYAERFSVSPTTGMAGDLKFIDVPASQAEQFRAVPGMGSGQFGEFVLPPELAQQARFAPFVRERFERIGGKATPGTVEPVIPGVTPRGRARVAGAADLSQEEARNLLQRFTEARRLHLERQQARGRMFNPHDVGPEAMKVFREAQERGVRSMEGVRAIAEGRPLPESERLIALDVPSRARPTALEGVAPDTPPQPRPGMGILDLPPGTARERLTSPVNETVQRLTNLIREAVPVREQTELLKSRELSQRAARVAERIQRGGATEEAFRTARGELAGQLPRARFEAPRPALAQEEVDSLFRRIEEYPGFDRLPLSKINAAEALTKTLGGELPTRGEIAILEQVFGEQLARAILSKRTLGRRAWETFVDAAGLPRALLSSMDLSGHLRQGALLIRRKEWWQAWGPAIRSLASEKFALQLDEILKTGPKAERRAQFGLELTDLGGVANRLTSREEGFMSRLAEKIPGLRHSQRAFTSALNKIRADIFDNRAARFDRMVENGQMTAQQRDAELAVLAKWLNIASGRGHLSQRVSHSDLMLLANRTFFSPRLNISRVQAFEMAGRVVTGRGVTPQMRRDIALDFAGYIGFGTGILALLNQAGVWDVELDPRSSDFAKGRVGSVRYDPWGGFQQIVRYAAQAAAGESRSTTTGEPREVDRVELVKRFLRSKLDPGIPAILVDLATGETFVGEDLDFQTSQGLTEEAKRRFLPLSIQDVLEAAEMEGRMAGIVSIPAALLGLGVTAFRNVGDVQNEVAIERFNQPYNRLNQGQRNTVNDDPRVQEQLATLERDVGSPREQVAQAFADWERVTTEAEAVLRAKLDAGVTGAARKRAISEFKERRFIAGDALFNNPTVAEELAKGDVPIEDALAERYWSIQPEENIATGNLDFATRDAQRARVLEEAQRLGVDLDYITGSGEGTYRGKRFEDPVVRQAIEQQEQTVDALAASGFFDIRDRVWQRVADRTGLPYADPDELYNEILRRVQDRGIDPARAMVVTNDIYNDLDAVKVWRDVSNDVEQAWIEMNPDLARRAIEFGYLQPGSLRQEEEEAILTP